MFSIMLDLIREKKIEWVLGQAHSSSSWKTYEGWDSVPDFEFNLIIETEEEWFCVDFGSKFLV